MRFSVLTNGSLLTPAVAERLRETGRCDEVQVSLDGSCAAVHESLRGVGTFAPALAAIRYLQAAGVPVTVRVTVHPGNIDDLSQVARLLLDELGLPAFSTNAASSLGSAGKYAAEVLLTPRERLRAMRTLVELEAVTQGASRPPPGRWPSGGCFMPWSRRAATMCRSPAGEPWSAAAASSTSWPCGPTAPTCRA